MKLSLAGSPESPDLTLQGSVSLRWTPEAVTDSQPASTSHEVLLSMCEASKSYTFQGIVWIFMPAN